MYDHLSNLAENALSHSNSRVDRDESSREKKTNMNSLLAAVALIQQQQKYNTHDKSKRGTNTRQSTIIEQKQSHSFEEMINYQEYIVNDRTTSINGLRQDNKDLMTFPNGSNERQLNQLTKHGLKDFYDLQVYLPSLMIVANSLNEPFQKTMKNMIVNNSEMGNGCLFKAAPIKQLSRAQAKAESDYAACPFPTSSHVLDLIRCSLVYDDCDSLMSGIKTFRKIIQQDVKNGCVKQVVRIKNMFLQNKKENPNGNWMDNYADIKFNVLIEHKGTCMIGEVQFLLQSMLNFKKKCHKFYSVTRQDEFVHDMNNILSISSSEDNMQQNFFFILHDSKNSVRPLAKFLISYSDKVDLLLCDERGMNAWHYCCLFGSMNMFELFQSVIGNSDDPTSMFELSKSIVGNYGDHLKQALCMETKGLHKRCCLQLAVASGDIQLVQTLCQLGKEFKINFEKQEDRNCENALSIAVKTNNLEIVKSLLGSKTFSLKYEMAGNENVIHVASWQSNYQMLKFLLTELDSQDVGDMINKPNKWQDTPLNACAWSTENYDVNDELNSDNFKCFQLLLSYRGIDTSVYDTSGYSAMLACIWLGKVEYVRYLLNKENQLKYGWNLNNIEDEKLPNGDNALMTAADGSCPKMLKYMLKTLNLNDSEAKGEALVKVCASTTARRYKKDSELECDNFKCFQLLLSDCNINVNMTDKNGYSALLNCIWHDKVEYVKYLLNKDNQNKYNWKLKDIRDDCTKDGQGALHVAAHRSSYNVLDYLLNKTDIFDKDDVNKPDDANATPLSKCAFSTRHYDSNDPLNCDNFKCFQLFLFSSGIDVNIRNKNGFSPMPHCIWQNKVEYVKYLLNKENQFKYNWKLNDIKNEKSNYDDNILMVAARGSCLKSLKYILNTLNYNYFDSVAKSEALMVVCKSTRRYKKDSQLECDNFESFKLLLSDCNINVNIKHKNGFSPILYCIWNDKIEYLKYLLNKKNQEKYSWKLNDIKHEKTRNDDNALMVAARGSSPKSLKYMLNTLNLFNIKQASQALNTICSVTRGYKQDTELKCDNYECFEFLLSLKGINVNIVNENKMSPFENCIQTDKVEFIKYLISNNKKHGWKMKDIRKQKALMCAAHFGSFKAVEYLLSLNVFDIKEQTDVMMQLCFSTNNYDAENPLQCNNFKCLDSLMKHMDDVTFALIHSIASKKSEYCEYLLNNWVMKLDKRTIDANGHDILMTAAGWSNFKILSKVTELNLFEDINNVNFDGDSALMICAQSDENFDQENQEECENYKCFQLLTKQNGIDLNIQNNDGHDVYHICISVNKPGYLQNV